MATEKMFAGQRVLTEVYIASVWHDGTHRGYVVGDLKMVSDYILECEKVHGISTELDSDAQNQFLESREWNGERVWEFARGGKCYVRNATPRELEVWRGRLARLAATRGAELFED